MIKTMNVFSFGTFQQTLKLIQDVFCECAQANHYSFFLVGVSIILVNFGFLAQILDLSFQFFPSPLCKFLFFFPPTPLVFSISHSCSGSRSRFCSLLPSLLLYLPPSP